MAWLINYKLSQSIINFLYRYPKAKIKNINRFGGGLNYYKMIRNRGQMEQSSVNLPAVKSYTYGLPIYFLTGKRYLYQTLFCIQSLAHVTQTKFKFILVDDGSFDDKLIARINLQLPGATVITTEIINENLENHLPKEKHKALHQKRLSYPHIKKLIDIHTLPGDEWKLVLDSDMLFWDEPTELIKWLQKPERSLHMIDCIESYGYSTMLMESISDSTIKPLINVGVIGLNSHRINWDKLENWVKILEEKEGTSYYLEQALTAMLIGDNPSIRLNAEKYIVNPTKETVQKRTGILHHYVDLSKNEYYKMAWRNII
jgi:hypothetical protein